MTNLGGNLVEAGLKLPDTGTYRLASTPYTYFFQSMAADSILEVPGLASCTVYLLRKDSSTSVVVQDKLLVNEGDVVQFENQPVHLKVQAGKAAFLVAGTEFSPGPGESCRHTPAGELYRVTKPWGHELWLNGRHAAYCLKRLEVAAGTRTSLQYHEQKHETTLFIQGTAALHYRSGGTTNSAELAKKVIDPITCVTTPPPSIHRVEAITDLVYYEASTAHLDDVIRLQDDELRQSGRIAGEHPR